MKRTLNLNTFLKLGGDLSKINLKKTYMDCYDGNRNSKIANIEYAGNQEPNYHFFNVTFINNTTKKYTGIDVETDVEFVFVNRFNKPDGKYIDSYDIILNEYFKHGGLLSELDIKKTHINSFTKLKNKSIKSIAHAGKNEKGIMLYSVAFKDGTKIKCVADYLETKVDMILSEKFR